jgi:hypothetical protein
MRLLYIASDGRIILTDDLIGDKIPPYAILSHTWQEGEEVTFEDFEIIENVRQIKAVDKSGYRKIRFCGQQAKRDALDYFWVDTCCIDKSNSSELQEAINSMFKWYKNATKCYVYLFDISIEAPALGEEVCIPSQLQNCRWFTRGWTLQELIATEDVTFFDCDWNSIGSKKRLVETIAGITGIDSLVLSHRCKLHELSVAKRLSWAALRQTTRVEDQAYCLLGLMDINMTLIYGEGEKAFKRLQDELIRKSADGSLFLWFRGMDTGILAASPSRFLPCGKIVQTQTNGVSYSWEMTHRGLRLTLPVLQQHHNGTFLGILACRMEDDYTHVLALHLRKQGQDNTWGGPVMICSVEKCTMECGSPEASVRELCGIHPVPADGLGSSMSTTILVPLHNFQTHMKFSVLRSTQSVWIRNRPASFLPIQAFPDHQWNLRTMTLNRYKNTFAFAEDYRQVGAVLFEYNSTIKVTVCFAVSYKAQFIKVCGGKEPLESICKGLNAATPHQYSTQSIAVHHIQPVCGTSSVQVQASLDSEKIMGEEVWVIDLTLVHARNVPSLL